MLLLKGYEMKLIGRSQNLLTAPSWVPPQVAIDAWWKENGLDHEEARLKRQKAYKKQLEDWRAKQAELTTGE